MEKDSNSWRGWGKDVRVAILCGDLDEDLYVISDAVDRRMKVLEMAPPLSPGGKVFVPNLRRPKAWAEKDKTVIVIRRRKKQ